jgi:membrane protease YdiL (CAAX protease family)
VSDAVFWSLLVIAVLAVQAAESPPRPTAGDAVPPPLGPFANPAAIARAVIAGGAVLAIIVGLFSLAGANGTGSTVGDRNHELVSGALQVAAGGISLALFYFGTHRVPGLRRLREGSPISWLAILLFFESLALNLVPTASGATSATNPVPQPSRGPSAESLMLGAVPFLAIGVASVGPFVRRNLKATAERLGFWPLRLPWWVIGLAAGIVLVPVGDWLAGVLAHLTSTQCLQQATQAQQQIIGTGRTALEQVGVAVAAAVGEETLFRGALQPRFGIFLSSALWASYHLQYACNGLPSTSNLYILLLGFVFGGLRKWGGLWPAIFAHAVYDATILLGWLGSS